MVSEAVFRDIYKQAYREGQRAGYEKGVYDGRQEMKKKYGEDFFVWCEVKGAIGGGDRR